MKNYKSLTILITAGIFLIILFGCQDKDEENNLENLFSSFPDNHTVALWLFDETEYAYTTVCDAGIGAYDLRLMPAAHLTPGKFGNCLSLSGGTGYAVSYAGFAGKVVNNHLREADGTVSGLWGPTEVPEKLLKALASNNWTVEFWLKIDKKNDNITLIDLGQGYKPGFTLKFDLMKNFLIIDAYGGFQASCPADFRRISNGQWHQLAFIRSGSSIHYFLDGVKKSDLALSIIPLQPLPDLQQPDDREHEHRGFGKMNFEQRRQNRFNIASGQQRSGGNIMHGMVDELRVSNIARYAEDFSLPKSFARKFGAYGARPSKPAVPCGTALLINNGSAKAPLQFGLRRYVFIDDAIIDSCNGLQITMNRPSNKQKIDFVPKKSAWRPTVVDVDNIVYMYVPEGYSAAKGRTYLLTSRNGIHFTQPNESPVIDSTPLYGTFFKDTNAEVPQEEQFKLTAWVGNRGICLFLSPDGVHWRRNETLMLPLVSGGGAETFYDDQQGKYVTFIRRDASFRTEFCPGSSRAGVLFETSEPLKTWHFNPLDRPYYEGWSLPCVTCEGPTIISKSSAGQAYRTRAIKYPWAADTYLAFVWRYPRHLGDNPARHVDLGVSRDCRHWKFFESSQGWYIPIENDPDPEQISIYGLIRRGDEIWQYTDHGGAHGGDVPRTYYRWTQRLDGFVSLEGTGVAITKPLLFQGDKVSLIINSTGSIKIAVLNEKGMERGGFTISDCDLIEDSVNHKVTWCGNSDLSVFSNKPVRLKFELSNSKLFAFELKGEEIGE